MKPNNRSLWNAGGLLLLLAIANTSQLEGALKPKKPTSNTTTTARKFSGRYSTCAPKNTQTAFFAEGHKVEISETLQGETRIWIDYNSDDVATENEVFVGDASMAYIYAGGFAEQGNSTVSNGCQITMTGGSVAGIYAGGYACGEYSKDSDTPYTATVNGTVNIYVRGGSVGRIYPYGNGSGYMPVSTIAGTVNVLLYDCEYRSMYPIEDKNGVTSETGDYSVTTTDIIDFSHHINGGWSSIDAGFTHYVCQTGENSLTIKGNVEIPEHIDLTLDSIYVAEGANIRCLGYLRMSRCGGVGIEDHGTWTCHPLVRDHRLSSEVSGKDAEHHTLRCTACGEDVVQEHAWMRLESTATSSASAKHTKICAVCQYSVEEACDIVYTSCGDEDHTIGCSLCNHVFSTVDHTPKYNSVESLNASSHTAICGWCGVRYTASHDWNGTIANDANKHYSCSCGFIDESGIAHVYDANGVCEICHYEHTSHDYDENGVCTVCHKGCKHTYTTGIHQYDILRHYDECRVCGSWLNGEEHTYWYQNDGTTLCTGCGKICSHSNMAAGGDLCPDCGILFECRVKMADGSSFLTQSLRDAFLYINTYKTSNVTIELIHDVYLTSPVHADLADGTTLDLCGHDITLDSHSAGFSNMLNNDGTGTFRVVNSSYTAEQPNNEAAITCNRFIPVVSGANLYIGKGVNLSCLGIGKGNITIEGDLRIPYALIYGYGGALTLGKDVSLIIDYCLTSNDSQPIGPRLPQGLVVAEELAEGTLHTLIDRSDTKTKDAGPKYKTGVLHFVACTDHALDNATADAATSQHTGVCKHCGLEVSEAHRMTAAANACDDAYHTLKCAVCGLEDTEARQCHTFINSTQQCKGCGRQAQVALMVQGTQEPMLYGSLAEAWKATNEPGRVDTLTLLTDVAFDAPLTIATETIKGTLYVPFVLVRGAGHKLTYSGTGSAFVYPEGHENRDVITLCEGVKASSNLNELTVSDFGYVKSGVSDGEFSIVACDHGDGSLSYANNTKGETAVPTHRVTCSECRMYYDENHTFGTDGTCQKDGCTAELDPYAVVSADGMSNDRKFGTLEEAWADAVNYSHNSDKEVTITLQKDVVVTSQMLLTDDDADARIRLVGGENKITGTIVDPMFYVTAGHLTIASGTYQSMSQSLLLAECADGCVTLEGGTYLTGFEGFASLRTEGHRSYDQFITPGIKSMIKPGSYLKVNDNLNITIETPASEDYSQASGTIVVCTHPEGHLTVCTAAAATCTEDGMKAGYSYCNVCNSYVKTADNTCTDYAGAAIPATGHTFVNGKCSACNLTEKVATLTITNSSGTPYENNDITWTDVVYTDFVAAWNAMVDKTSYSRNVILTLYDDVDYSASTGLSLGSYDGDGNLTIDLNGHSLNMGNLDMIFGYWYGEGDFVIKNSQAGIKDCNWNLSFCALSVNKHLVIDNVHLSAKTLSFVKHLELKNGAIVSLGNQATASLSQLTMAAGTTLDSDGTSQICLYGDYDPSGTLAALMHNVTFGTNGQGGKTRIESSGSTSNDDPPYALKFYYKDGTSCSKWSATPSATAVSHQYGELTDNGMTHGGICAQCGFTGKEAHDYVDHACRICGHQAEAYVTIDGITTNYTYLFDVKKAEKVCLQGALSAANGQTAVVKLNADCLTSGSLGNEFYINNDYRLGNSSSETSPDGKHITLNLNGHKLDARLNVYNTALTITDAAEGGGKMYSGDNSHALYGGAGSNVVIKGGNFTTLVELQDAASASIEGGKFSKIQIGSTDVSTVLGRNCYFRSNEDNQALVTSVVTEPVYGSTNPYIYYLNNVYVVSNAQSMVADEDLDNHIDDRTKTNETPANQVPSLTALTEEAEPEPETSPYQTLINAALGNLSCRTFAGTGITAKDLKDPVVLDAIQKGLSRAGKAALINEDSDIESYVEATLAAMTIESVADGENGNVNVTTRMTFDVQPYALVNLGSESVSVAIENGLLQKEITFRLPVDSHVDAQLLAVSLDGNKVADCEVLRATEVETEYKYIQVTNSTMGTYSYMVNSSFILEDAVAFRNTNNLTNLTSAQYCRTFAQADVWEPLYAPMQFSYDDFSQSCYIASIYTFGIMADTDGDGLITTNDETILIVDPLTTGSTAESTPYVIRPKAAGTVTLPAVGHKVFAATDYNGSCSTTRTRYTFHGIYASKQVDARQTLVLEEGVVGEASLGDAIAPQRWYIEATDKTGGYNTNVEIEQARGAGIRVLAIGEDLDQETALRILRGETVDLWQDGQRFTIDGRRAVSAERGFQIVNGKKIMVKE